MVCLNAVILWIGFVGGCWVCCFDLVVGSFVFYVVFLMLVGIFDVLCLIAGLFGL